MSAQGFRCVLDNPLGNAVANCPAAAKISVQVVEEGGFVALHVKDAGSIAAFKYRREWTWTVDRQSNRRIRRGSSPD